MPRPPGQPGVIQLRMLSSTCPIEVTNANTDPAASRTTDVVVASWARTVLTHASWLRSG